MTEVKLGLHPLQINKTMPPLYEYSIETTNMLVTRLENHEPRASHDSRSTQRG